MWLAGRRQEQLALDTIIATLQQMPPVDVSPAVRGAGTAARTTAEPTTVDRSTPVRGNPDNLRQAAARKSAAAQTRAETALREMIRRHQPITFRGLAHNAGVSLDFLYRHPDLRRRVEQLRAQQGQPTKPAPLRHPTSRAASSAPSPPRSPSSSVNTVPRSTPSTKRCRPPTARTWLFAASSATEPATSPPLRLRTRPQALYLHKHDDHDRLPRINRRSTDLPQCCR